MNWNLIFNIFGVFGIGIFIYLTIITIHEYGHYWKFEQDGVKISEFVILGWKEDVTFNEGLNGMAWVQSKTNHNTTWHECWDFKRFEGCWN